jgi:hypothetical protein
LTEPKLTTRLHHEHWTKAFRVDPPGQETQWFAAGVGSARRAGHEPSF